MAQSWIRINQIGYTTDAIKVAVWVTENSESKENIKKFEICDALTELPVFEGKKVKNYNEYAAFKAGARLDFSELHQSGQYFVRVGKTRSPIFRISDTIWNGTTDFLLQSMRQQRCGYNPFFKKKCHRHGCFAVGHEDPLRDGTNVAVWGGWHNGNDYLQYVTTSANAVTQLLFAYQQNPNAFKDEFDADGNQKPNQIPDILDEAKWGLDWLARMNPNPEEMYHQIADDRGHQMTQNPDLDTITYSTNKGLMRPAYRVTGKPQGLQPSKNRTTGVASIAGKFASAFWLGSQILKKHYPQFADNLKVKAESAYQYGQKYQGVCQTVPYRTSAFYEEENWADDMELAAAVASDAQKLKEAIDFGKKEPITPWMGADAMKPHQWYPFANLGHFYLANSVDSNFFKQSLLNGIDSIAKNGENNPFLNGFPRSQDSNHLVAAGLSQIRFCQKLKIAPAPYAELEATWRDWLFGCNPSGTNLVYPNNSNAPHEESTIDGTASLMYYLSSLQQNGVQLPVVSSKIRDKYGAIVRKDTARMKIYFIFAGHEFADAGQTIIDILKKNNVKASFFLTGDFYRANTDLVKTLKADGHYLGAHSDKHLLYCDWKKRDSLLVSKADFRNDLKQNFVEMSKLGISKEQAKYFLPPFEWYNSEITAWCREAGLELVNYTSGTRSQADYTTPNDKNYVASKTIYRSIIDYEMRNPTGLNGFILLMHIGTDPLRTDKMYQRLERLVQELKEKGYSFERF
jgi:endoglucanase